jgi:4-hydroxy-tetrahydrodipicolinate reductase
MPKAVLGVIGTGQLADAVGKLAVSEGHALRAYDPRHPDEWQAVPAPDVIIDCSAPPVLDQVADLCRDVGRPLVECVSGLTAAQLERLAELGKMTTVVLAVNLSLGNYLQARALRCIAEILVAMEKAGVTGAIPEAAIVERHPATKAHRPSSTAVAFGQEWQECSGHPVGDISSLRAGWSVSEHQVRLAWANQALTLTHEVRYLDAAAAGALGAATWAVGQAPGRYTLHQVFDQLVDAMAAHAASGVRPPDKSRGEA